MKEKKEVRWNERNKKEVRQNEKKKDVRQNERNKTRCVRMKERKRGVSE